ncbi:MAG: RnfABCDGE type electron transport complex subunit D [Acutalibacteraceae bacterium]|nr:RnfABCDGE type electron transport complex subunit D [Acutalibacteraceae bacterium]
MNKLAVSVSPHIHTNETTRSIMLDVIIALLPASVASVIFFGIKALFLISTSIIFSVMSEWIFSVITKRKSSISDLSAVVTGLILGLNVTVSLPLWQIAVGAIFATFFVKMLFGGIGQNFANPAITARIIMLLSFGGTMTNYAYPTDAVSAATPLALMKSGAYHKVPETLDLFLGKCGGCLGETSALALIIGGLYLYFRRVITLHTPLSFIATVFVLSFIFGRPPLKEILSGGLIFGAIYMATDYSSSPVKKSGKIIFGIGCGLITMLIRKYGTYPEGVSFAILFMNILAVYIEKITIIKPLGVGGKHIEKAIS